jgi:hypothetical protein
MLKADSHHQGTRQIEWIRVAHYPAWLAAPVATAKLNSGGKARRAWDAEAQQATADPAAGDVLPTAPRPSVPETLRLYTMLNSVPKSRRCGISMKSYGGRHIEPMSSITIRNLDPSIKARLRVRAAEHGHRSAWVQSTADQR